MLNFYENYTNFVLGTLSSGDERLRNALADQSSIQIVDNGVGNFSNSITLNKVSNLSEITYYKISYDNISNIELIFKHEGTGYNLKTVDSVETLYIIPSYTSGEGGNYPEGGTGGNPWIDEGTGIINNVDVNDDYIVFYARLKGATYLNELTISKKVNLGSNYSTIVCYIRDEVTNGSSEATKEQIYMNDFKSQVDLERFCLIHLWGDFQPRLVEYSNKLKLESRLDKNKANLVDTLDNTYQYNYQTLESISNLSKDNNIYTLQLSASLEIESPILIRPGETLRITNGQNINLYSELVNFGTIEGSGLLSTWGGKLENYGDISIKNLENYSTITNYQTGLINSDIVANDGKLNNYGIIDIKSSFTIELVEDVTNNSSGIFLFRGTIFGNTGFENNGRVYYSTDQTFNGNSFKVDFVQGNTSREEATRLNDKYISLSDLMNESDKLVKLEKINNSFSYHNKSQTGSVQIKITKTLVIMKNQTLLNSRIIFNIGESGNIINWHYYYT